MGGHGLYVWLSYGVAAIVLGLNYLLPAARRKLILREQVQRLRREESGL